MCVECRVTVRSTVCGLCAAGSVLARNLDVRSHSGGRVARRNSHGVDGVHWRVRQADTQSQENVVGVARVASWLLVPPPGPGSCGCAQLGPLASGVEGLSPLLRSDA